MKVAVYSLKTVLFEGEAEAINTKTKSGEITVLNNHRPLIAALEKGVVKIVDTDKKEHFFNVSSGFLEVNADNQVKLIVEER